MGYVATRNALRDMTTKWMPHLILVEEKANGAALMDDLAEEFPQLVPFVPDRHGDKVARAEVASRVFEAGSVHLPDAEWCPWVGDYVENLAAFPTGAHDDDIDATSQILIYWLERGRGGAGAEAFEAAVEAVLGGKVEAPRGPKRGPRVRRMGVPASDEE